MPTVNYLWNPLNDNIVREFDDDGNVIADYTTEPDLHGAVISEHRDGETHFHLHDGQGNTVALTNDEGEVTDTFAYTANGEVTERTGNTPTPYQYKGEHGYYTDQTTGEVIVRRRPFGPSIARWLSADPLGTVDDVNPYRYVRNNPNRFIDPSGLERFDCEKGRKHVRCSEIRHPPFVAPPPEERIDMPRPAPVVDLPCEKGCELVIDVFPEIDEFGRLGTSLVPVCLCCIPFFVGRAECKSGHCAICSLSRVKIIKHCQRPFIAYETVHQCTCVESPFAPFEEIEGRSPRPSE